MRAAMEDAGLSPEDVQVVNAHGTSTPMNDVIESKAIRRAFGPHADALAVHSTKSMIGHCMGGAGGIEAVVAVLTLRSGMVHPTINLHNPDPECDLDYVPEGARKMDVDVVLSNSFGFGGHNGVLAFRRFSD
jgi:3-oxoacyl-[acyl-carrier-protein] synthase II